MAWSAMLAVYSVMLEESDDMTICHYCLEGLIDAIKISSMFGMSTERNAFVSTLSKFTSLSTIK
jgi:brefeldin A-inhibited guanine nucleotide-exchange protein